MALMFIIAPIFSRIGCIFQHLIKGRMALRDMARWNTDSSCPRPAERHGFDFSEHFKTQQLGISLNGLGRDCQTANVEIKKFTKIVNNL
jgi:hypothetical protein